MDDRAPAAVAGQFASGHEGGDGGRGDGVAVLVDDEAAVGVAVEGEAEVGALLADAPLEVDEVGRVERVGLVVGEGAVQFEVHRYEVEGQAGEDRGDGVAAHAVARVDDDLEGPGGAEVDEGAQVGRVVGEGVAPGDLARTGHGLRGAGVAPAFHQGAYLGEAGVLADRGGARAAQLDAVVPRGVVRGREHGARQAERAGGVVQLVGGAQADLGHVGTTGRRPAREGTGQARGRRPHVVADHDGARAGQLDEGRAEQLGQRLVPLVRDDTAHVVRLHDLRQISSHGQPS